jgi:iron complex outermembrane recepter protein
MLKNRVSGTSTVTALAASLSFLASLAGAAEPQTASQEESKDQLEEILVTGQRRTENLQEAAVAVNAFTAETLENANVTRPGDVLKLAPNVTFVQSNHPGEFYVTIRGNTQTRLGESSVALVVDGVQSLDQNSINQELFEIQQIEVLKGPQGALYGRNAIGGALVITTKEPDFEEWGGRVKVGGANGSELTGQVGFSGPLGERFALRGAVAYRDRDGYYKNNNTGERVDRFEEKTGFLRGLWKVTDNVTGDFRLGAADTDGGGIAWNAILALPPAAGGNAPALSGDNTELPYVNNIGGFATNERTTASMKWDFELGPVKLVSTSSYAKLKDNYGSDSYPYFNDAGLFNVFFPGNTPIGLGAQTQNLQRESEIVAQELRLQSSNDGDFQWMVGAYYADFEIQNISTTGADTNGVLLGLGPFPFGSQNQTLSYLNDTNDNKAYAGFASITYDNGPFEITASVRYDKEEKEQTDNAFPGPAAAADPKSIPTYRIQAFRSREAEFSQTQPKLAARYSFNDSISMYASWGRGFKTGGFNPFGTGALLRSFNPASSVGDVFPKEVADTWEIGFKSTWLDRRLSFNVSYFDTKSDNAQLLEFFPQATLQAISTADEVKMSGFEVELNARPVEGLDLVASYGYLDSEVSKFASNPSFVGNRRPSTSPYTAMLAAQYATALGTSGWELVGRTDFTRQGRTVWDWADTPGGARSPFNLINARFAVKNDNWEIAAWGKNLGDEEYNSEHIVLLPFAGALYRAAPRTYGAEVAYRF